MTQNLPSSGRCTTHPAFDADYCPVCGTTTPIAERRIPDARTVVETTRPMSCRACHKVAPHSVLTPSPTGLFAGMTSLAECSLCGWASEVSR